MKYFSQIIIIIPTYNSLYSLKYVLNAIENINYSKERIGIIFIDGGSSDGTIEYLKNWCIRAQDLGYMFTEVIELNRRGVALARNVGLAKALEAQAEYIFMLDSDVIPPSNFLYIALGDFRKDLDIGIVAAPVMTKKPNLFELLNASRWPYPYGFVETAPPGAWLISSKCIKDVGFFNEKLGYPHSDWEQAEYSARARRHGYKLVVDWRLKCVHTKPKINTDTQSLYKDKLKDALKCLTRSLKRYTCFLPPIWHEVIKARPRYYITITLLHIISFISIIICIAYVYMLAVPLCMVLMYFLQNIRNRAPVPMKAKVLSAIGLLYMRTLISLSYLGYILKRVIKRNLN